LSFCSFSTVASKIGALSEKYQEDTHSGGSPGLLRLSGERRGEEAASQAADERPPVHYSIT
jgi:hypothetical protein